nr:cytochrome P450 monooxygenase CYP366A1 [Ephestia elutella]
MISLLLGTLLLACAYCVTYLKERRARSMLKDLPSLSYLPFVGSMHHFLGGPEAIFRKLEETWNKAEETDKPVLIWIGYNPALMLCNPEDVKMVTNAFTEKPHCYSFTKLWLGDDTAVAPGSIWKRTSKKSFAAGSFTAARVESYQERFSSQATKLTEQLKAEAGRPPFDVVDILETNTLETICLTALGTCYSSDSSFMEQYCHSFKRTLALVLQRGFNIHLHPEFIYRLTLMYQELKKHVAVLHQVTNTVMSQVIGQNKNIRNSKNDKNGKPQAKYKSYLEKLLELQSRDPEFNSQQIQYEVHNIIFAGQETLATALFFIFSMLGCHRTVQRTLYQELKEIFGDSKRAVTKEDLDHMPYCEAVISETLRLYPPAPSFLCHADQDLKIRSCTIPKGTVCAIGVWGLCRSQRLWGPDALQYRPERWLEPDCPGNSPAFAAFSYGRRACIGKKYAMAFLKTALAQCVRELEFQSEADKLQLKMDVVLRPVSNYLIQVRRRDETMSKDSH